MLLSQVKIIYTCICFIIVCHYYCAFQINMQTLKFKAQPTNAFFATVNQKLGGSSLVLTTAEQVVIKSNCWAQLRQHSQKLGRAAKHLIDGSAKTHLSVEVWILETAWYWKAQESYFCSKSHLFFHSCWESNRCCLLILFQILFSLHVH